MFSNTYVGSSGSSLPECLLNLKLSSVRTNMPISHQSITIGKDYQTSALHEWVFLIQIFPLYSNIQQNFSPWTYNEAFYQNSNTVVLDKFITQWQKHCRWFPITKFTDLICVIILKHILHVRTTCPSLTRY